MQDMLEKNLEIRCDLTVTENLEQIEQITYLETIVKALKNIEKKKKHPPGELVRGNIGMIL